MTTYIRGRYESVEMLLSQRCTCLIQLQCKIIATFRGPNERHDLVAMKSMHFMAYALPACIGLGTISSQRDCYQLYRTSCCRRRRVVRYERPRFVRHVMPQSLAIIVVNLVNSTTAFFSYCVYNAVVMLPLLSPINAYTLPDL